VAPPIAIERSPALAPGSAENETLQKIVNAVLPREDLADLAVRFKGITPQQAEVVCNQLAQEYPVGATRSFTLSNQDNNELFQIEARLEYKTPHAYMWVQTAPRRVRLNVSRLRRAADEFENKIYPTTRDFFGSEASPGVDCDPRLHVLHASGIGASVGGYFSSPDGYSRAVRPDSNQAELFVIHAARGYGGANPGSEAYMSTLAHEFQHMISFNQAHAPDLWLEEGAAQLAERLNGYADSIGTVYAFAAQPETQLNTWSETSAGANSAHYGGGYLFWSYAYDRFGDAITRKLARATERSEQSLIKVLADNGVVNPDTNRPFTFEELFADFVVANYMGQERVEATGNRFNYATIDVPPMSARAILNDVDYPYETQDSAEQFGTHYLELKGDTPVTIDFVGSTVVSLLPTKDANGQFWWSNRADVSNPRLTREFDLSSAPKATLKYRAWHRLEKGYDYAYVSVSEDGGLSWKLLNPPSCTTANPQGANLGCGYNAASGAASGASSNDGSAPQAEWIDEQIDLGQYAGRKILLRFEVVTDAGVNREGLAVDNIEIPEIGFKDDAESSDNGWQAEGFVRVGNTLPQMWAVQVIVTNQDGSRAIQRIPLDNNIGSARLNLGNGVRSAVLAISPTTLVTTEPGAYQLKIK
jgi:hypothetical protein